MFVEVESLEKADEMCKAGLLWYGRPCDGDFPEGIVPWGTAYETDNPMKWGSVPWKYYILLEA